MNLRGRPWLAMSMIVGLALVTASCGGDEDDTADGGTATDNTVAATLTDFSITLDQDSGPAGDVTFDVTNEAAQMHEFVVLKTDLPEDQLPTDEDGNVDEAGDPGIELVDEIEDVEGGATQSLTVTMDAGSYVLICNLPGHYAQGMHTSFSVE